MSTAADFDTEPMGIDEFIHAAKKDLDNFAANVHKIQTLVDKQMTQFQWYMTFGHWAEYLDYFDELKGDYNAIHPKT